MSHVALRSALRNLEPVAELRVDKGLYLRRTAPGDFWFFRYLSPITGKQVRMPLWSAEDGGVKGFPEASLEAARLRASTRRAEVAAGIDPAIKIEQDRQAAARNVELARLDQEAKARAAEDAAAAAARRITIRTLFEQWQRVELAPHTLADGSRTGRKDGGQWVKASFERRLFPRLGDVPAADVRKPELLAILDETKANGQRRTANVLLADLRQMFRFAAEREIIARNPLEGIKRSSVGGKDVERDRTLTEDEIKLLFTALLHANMGPRSVAAVGLILATACRVGEAMSARWEHIDLERRCWYLPQTKNERDHTIHLSNFALQQVNALHDLREIAAAGGKPMPWVFPNFRGTGPVDVKSFGKQLADRQRPAEKRLQGRAKNTGALLLPGGRWTAHDLRRTAATLMAKGGVSTDVIDECLNHKLQSKVARVYIKDRRLPEQARAFDALGARLQQILYDRSGAVVPALQTPAA